VESDDASAGDVAGLLEGGDDVVPDARVNPKAFAGTFAPIEPDPEPPDGRAVELELSDAEISEDVEATQDKLYILQRGGIDEGPYDMNTLVSKVRRGEVTNVDTLRERETGKSMLAVDLPALREILQARALKLDLGARARPAHGPRPARPSSPPRQRGHGRTSTTILVVVVVLAFVAGAVMLWVKSSG
jgi:hypothetical protein